MQFDAVIFIGPGSATTWGLAPEFDQEALYAQKCAWVTSAVACRMDRVWETMDRTDKWHAFRSEENTKLAGNQIMAALSLVTHAIVIRKSFGGSLGGPAQALSEGSAD